MRGPLLPILHAGQAAFGCVPRESIPVIAHALNLTQADAARQDDRNHRGVRPGRRRHKTQPAVRHCRQAKPVPLLRVVVPRRVVLDAAALLATALALTRLTAIVPAQADIGSHNVPQIDVPYGDLNLSNAAGARVMLQRIKAAASRVCGGAPDLRFPVEVRRYRQCVRFAVDQAVAQLNRPMVTALHNGRPATDPRFARDGSK